VLLSDDILRERRSYFMDKVKKPLMLSLSKCANGLDHSRFMARIYLLWNVWVLVRSIHRYPKPTRDNLGRHNAVDIWEEFFEYEDNPGRDALFRALRRLSLGTYAHDGYYGTRADWFLERLVKKYESGEYQPRKPWLPCSFWKEPIIQEG